MRPVTAAEPQEPHMHLKSVDSGKQGAKLHVNLTAALRFVEAFITTQRR